MVVRKRDGRLEEFDSDKILESIKRAALAVEGKDKDIQRKSIEIQNIKRQLIQHGFSEDDAQEQAETQFEGYIEDGIYTEYNEDEAEEVVDLVLESIDGLGLDEDDSIDTDTIQDFVEKALVIKGHTKTAKEYIIKRANRERIREMNTSLMKSFEDLTFGNSKDIAIKRENANIDGDSAMGTMLKYGSEGAKKFNLLYVVPPDESQAHSNGDIHIHDLDFYTLTETCITENCILDIVDTPYNVDIKNNPESVVIHRAGDIDKFFDDGEIGWKDTTKSGLFIKSRNGMTPVNKIMRHFGKGKKLYTINIPFLNDIYEITGEHLVPVSLDIECNESSVMPVDANKFSKENEGKTWELRRLNSFNKGDEFYALVLNDINNTIMSAKAIVAEVEDCNYHYVYDIETGDNYFYTTGLLLHNCCQIDLEKLFKGGFNTGHGFLREPGEIRSYAALACIAIQSNQNDQHKRII